MSSIPGHILLRSCGILQESRQYFQGLVKTITQMLLNKACWKLWCIFRLDSICTFHESGKTNHGSIIVRMIKQIFSLSQVTGWITCGTVARVKLFQFGISVSLRIQVPGLTVKYLLCKIKQDITWHSNFQMILALSFFNSVWLHV